MPEIKVPIMMKKVLKTQNYTLIQILMKMQIYHICRKQLLKSIKMIKQMKIMKMK